MSGVGAQGPVVVLAGTVNTGKGLFVKQTDQIVLCGNLLHDGHHHLVIVTCGIHIGEDGGQLMLTGCTFIVLGLAEDAQAANDYASLLERFEKKIYDLELTRMISVQMAPQIRLIQNNDAMLIEKIQTSQECTLSSSRRTDDRHYFAFEYFLADSLENLQISEVLFQINRFYNRYTVISH